MININDEIKQVYDLSTTQTDKIILNNQEYKISNVEFYDDVYKDGNIFGTAIGKCLDFEIENSVNLEGQEIEYQTGIVANGVTHWISLGNFIVYDIEPNDTTNMAKVSTMDYMLKTNVNYVSKLNYGDGTVKLLDVLQEVCNNSKLTLATAEFANSNFIVDSNQFEEGTLNRQVIQAVAQISGTIAKIKNNSLYLINPNSVTSVSKVFTLNSYEEAEIKRNTQPINLVSLGMADIEGENIVLRDEASISKNGENSLAINDNPFAYTQAKREQLITALFDAVKGFEYKAYSFKCQGLPYLETMDKIQFLDKECNTYDSYVFRFNYKSPKGLESTIEAPSIIKATVAYQNVLDAIEISKRTEILVDKQNQTIQSVVSQTDAQNQKISEVTQTVNELNSKIGDISDITTSKESTNAVVEFEKINQSEPIYVKIHSTGKNISYLYPRDNLYPSDDLFMTVRTLRFTNTTTNEIFDYELPTDLLYYDASNYDEFILDYDALSCEVNKRVGYNADGTTYLLDAVKTIKYDFPRIELTDGDYKIELLGYSNAYLFVRLMAQNYYTTQFATRAEMNSEISQTAEEINSSVDKKLSNYSTTTEMNAAISVKANEINSTVSETYTTKTENTNTLNSAKSYTDTQVSSAKSEIKQTTDSISSTVSKKVGNDEVISKINQSAETVGINATKINLSAADILNLLAGNTINLKSQNIVITSDNFSVDSNGNMTCKSATINNGNLTITSDGLIKQVSEDSGLQLLYMEDNDYKSYIGPNNISLKLKNGNGSIDITLMDDTEGNTRIYNHKIYTPELEETSLTQLSLEEIKKNILPYTEHVSEIIKNSEIYTYNLKTEEDTDKKHIGFVIGDKYKTPKQVLSKKGQGIDLYSMSSLLWKNAQEQQKINEILLKRVQELEAR